MSNRSNRNLFSILFVFNVYLIYRWKGLFPLDVIAIAGTLVSFLLLMLFLHEVREEEKQTPIPTKHHDFKYHYFEVTPNEYGLALINELKKSQQTSEYWQMTAQELTDSMYYYPLLYRYRCRTESCELYLEDGQVSVYVDGVNVGVADETEKLKPILDTKYTTQVSALGGEAKEIKETANGKAYFGKHEEHEYTLYIKVTQTIDVEY